MTDHTTRPMEEVGLAVKFGLVGMVGFVVDALLLKGGLMVHLTPAVARLISIVCAMQVTFLINRRHVFKHCAQEHCLRQWCAYMGANGFGNFCSYWIFLTLTSLHGHAVSSPLIAMPLSTFTAYLINYAGTRIIVFGRSHVEARRGPPSVGTSLSVRAPASPSPSPR